MIKHGIAIGDFHCGHKVGLTPPNWQIRVSEKSSTKRPKWSRIQSELWDEFIILKVILSNPLNQLIAVKQIFTIKKRR